ncbi:TadE family protein [Nocardioides sp. B-3]|uniref:TadE family protein n=1 Tax=Nocardioides sp. B-3 TaxID=2895565 RepID=UPI002153317E|nr:TadE family protein [Nocardioides sp. B-3]UUZ60852.1 pilus assembly protein [Nocardioides sp. B-3]
MRRRRSGCERGAATAELALGLPLVLAVTVGPVWLLAAASAQIRVVDAARESARSMARGDSESAAGALGATIAPTGADIELELAGGRVAATASARVDGPGGLFDFLPGVTVRSRAVAVLEEA